MPYLCVCAVLQSILQRHGYDMDQLEIAMQLGVTIPISAISNATLKYQNLSFSDNPKEIGTHIGGNTLNDFFKNNSFSLKETFISNSQIGELNFSSILESIDESYDAILFFDYGTLFGEPMNKNIGHCGLLVSIDEDELKYADPGPKRFGVNTVSIDDIYAAIKTGHQGAGISIIGKVQ